MNPNEAEAVTNNNPQINKKITAKSVLKGCLIVILILMGIPIFCGILFVCCASEETKEKYMAEQKKVAEEKRIAKEKKLAELAERKRVAEEKKAAELAEKRRAAEENMIEWTARDLAKKTVLKNLLCPASAKNWKMTVSHPDRDYWCVTGSVDAVNTYNAPIRMNFRVRCHRDAEKQILTVTEAKWE